ncbi:MAG: hypothetical protein WKF30_02780 [Pyrinomonadaceae bacterium]
MPHLHYRCCCRHNALCPARVLTILLLALSFLLATASAPQARPLAQSAPQRDATSGSTKDAQEEDVRALAPGTPLERELAGGESHSYRITLNAGEYLHVAVEQRGINGWSRCAGRTAVS